MIHFEDGQRIRYVNRAVDTGYRAEHVVVATGCERTSINQPSTQSLIKGVLFTSYKIHKVIIISLPFL